MSVGKKLSDSQTEKHSGRGTGLVKKMEPHKRFSNPFKSNPNNLNSKSFAKNLGKKENRSSSLPNKEKKNRSFKGKKSVEKKNTNRIFFKKRNTFHQHVRKKNPSEFEEKKTSQNYNKKGHLKKQMKDDSEMGFQNFSGKNHVHSTGILGDDAKETLDTRGKKRKLSESDHSSEPKDKMMKMLLMKKKDRKRLRQKHDAKTDIYDIGVKIKHIWEELRRSQLHCARKMKCKKLFLAKEDCKVERKHELLKELVGLVKGRTRQLIFAHDTVRVIETLVALGSVNHRNMLFEELKDHIIEMSKSKYAKFFLLKLLKYGTKEQKNFIVKSFYGHVGKLIKHTEGAAVLECAYNEYANATQRAELVQEFYGPTFAHFKDSDCKTLAQLLEKDPTQKSGIINHMKELLMKITEKTIIRHSIIHFVLREFFMHADLTSRSEIIEAIRESLVEILHTKDGSRVAMNCVWHGTAKDRKAIIKSMKTHVSKIAKEEHGHMVLLAIFDAVDDTKLVEKAIVKELNANLMELVQNQEGRKVLLYLLHHRDSHFFHPDVVNILKQGDGNATSKKDPEIRRKELLQSISGPLLNLIKTHSLELMKNNAVCLLVLSVFQTAVGDPTDAMTAVAKLAVDPYCELKGENQHVVEHPGVHYMLKKLILDDKLRKSQNSVLFSNVLIDTIPEGILQTWMNCNRGAFLLLSLLETGIPSVISRINTEMKGAHKALAKKKFKGAEILLEKLEGF